MSDENKKKAELPGKKVIGLVYFETNSLKSLKQGKDSCYLR